MNTDDALVLLALAASIDNRKPSRAAGEQWAHALSDIPLDPDCKTAVTLYYGTAGDVGERRWLQPHHVRTIRASIRADRIDQSHALYEGQPSEGPAEFLDRRRAQLAAAAEGHLGTQPIRAALNGPPHPAVGEHLGHAVQYLPDLIRADLEATVPGWAKRAEKDELAIACPVELCRARPRRDCTRPTGARRKTSHPSRIDLWAAQQAQPHTA